MFKTLSILRHQGKQYIPDVTTTDVPGCFRGRPVISSDVISSTTLSELSNLCPTGALSTSPLSIDLGKCLFCGECAFRAPENIRFTKDYHLATNDRSRLIVSASSAENTISLDPDKIRRQIRSLFRRSLKLRQVSAGGDGSCELELNATGNVNFDIGRFGIDFVASPRHADGIVLTGPISENMADSFLDAYNATPDPKLLILAGTEAISGGIWAGSPALRRNVLDGLHVDLYIPGNPVHPLTFVNGVLDLLGLKNR